MNNIYNHFFLIYQLKLINKKKKKNLMKKINKKNLINKKKKKILMKKINKKNLMKKTMHLLEILLNY